MNLVVLAARNLLRNRWRAALTFVTVALGSALLVIVWSTFDGENRHLVESMTAYHTGHAQIVPPAALRDRSLEHAFEPRQALAAASRVAGIEAAAPRLSGPALAVTDHGVRGVEVTGVDPLAETRVTALHRRIAVGAYLQPGARGSVLVGRTLARALGVQVGDELALLTDGMRGAMGAQRLVVAGLFASGTPELDAKHVFITLADAQDLFVSGERVTAVALRLHDPAQATEVADQAGALAGPGLTGAGWPSLLPGVAEEIRFHHGVEGLMLALLAGIVGLGVANAMLMSVAERTHEFGVLLAIGMRPRQLTRLIVCEALLVAASGFAAGTAVAVGYLAVSGSEFAQHHATSSGRAEASSAPSRGAPGHEPGAWDADTPHRLRSLLQWHRVATLAAATVAVVLAASLYPALRVARLSPAQALHGGPRARSRTATRKGAAPWGARWLLLRLALRNVLRAPARSALVVTAIAVGLAAHLFIAAFAHSGVSQMVGKFTGLLTGDAQVQHRDFRHEGKPSQAFAAPPEMLARLQGVEGVAAVAPRVESAAVLASAWRSESVALVGVDPAREPHVSLLHQAVAHGAQALGGEREIRLGAALAEKLKVGVGDKVVVTVPDVSGQLSADAFTVASIYRIGSSPAHGPDSGTAFVVLPKLQRMLGIGDHVTSVVVRASDRTGLGATLRRLSDLLPADAPLAVLGWPTLMPELASVEEHVTLGVSMVVVVTSVMVTAIAMNLLLMSVFERFKEFGTVLAIGARPRSLVGLLMLEAACLAAAGVAAGMACAIAILEWLGAAGLHLGVGMGAAISGVTDVIHPQWTWALIGAPSAGLFVLVVAAALYPAIKVARLDPAVVLRRP